MCGACSGPGADTETGETATATATATESDCECRLGVACECSHWAGGVERGVGRLSESEHHRERAKQLQCNGNSFV